MGDDAAFQHLVSMVGRRADDEALATWIETDLKKKVPSKTTAAGGGKYVVAKKQGLECLFFHDVKHPDYPPHKNGRSFVPYLTAVWIREKFTGTLPRDLTLGQSPDELTALLGKPTKTHRIRGPIWHLPVGENVRLVVDKKALMLAIDEGQGLDGVSEGVRDVFVRWAGERGLLGADADLGRGLWTTHLINNQELRDFAFDYFHRLGDLWIKKDLIDAFGARKGPHGHDEPAIDDVEDALPAATKILDERFSAWVK
ncbi:MAG: hypothetical protein AAGE52_34020 [Myxococcota bacterium]